MPEDCQSNTVTWRNGLYSDWTIVVGPRRFQIHRLIFGSGERRSFMLVSAFKQPFENTISETDLSKALPEFTWTFFDNLLDYVYTGNVSLSATNWGPMLKFADVLQIPALHALCINEFDEILQVRTAVEVCKSVSLADLPEGVCAQVIQNVAETMAFRFTTGRCEGGLSPKQVLLDKIVSKPSAILEQRWFMRVLVDVLHQECLEVCTEDEVLDVLLLASKELSQEDTAMLKQTLRLAELSPAKLMEVAGLDIFSKAELVLAGMQRGFSAAPGGHWPKDVVRPEYRGATCMKFPRGRFRFLVRDPLMYQPEDLVTSCWKELASGFKCRLEVFPKGTRSTGDPFFIPTRLTSVTPP